MKLLKSVSARFETARSAVPQQPAAADVHNHDGPAGDSAALD